MDWCNANGVDCLCGLAGHGVFAALAAVLVNDLKVHRAVAGAEGMLAFASLA